MILWFWRSLSVRLNIGLLSELSSQIPYLTSYIVQQDHDYQNVVMVVRETPKTEQIVSLEDSDGEFLQCDHVYTDAPPRHACLAEDTRPIEDLSSQLEEADNIITAARVQYTYPLHRIDDLLDQLGSCRFFSMLDLASGYWQT